MLTKAQKAKHIEAAGELLKKSKTLVFADFTGVATAEINRLKAELRKTGAVFRVVKKRLLKLAFKSADVPADPTQFKAQVGTVFAPGELTDIAAPIFKFSKELAKAKKNFAVLGAYEAAQKSFVTPEQFLVIAKLPSREVLLAQVLGAFTAPLRAFMNLLEQLAKSKKPLATSH